MDLRKGPSISRDAGSDCRLARSWPSGRAARFRARARAVHAGGAREVRGGPHQGGRQGGAAAAVDGMELHGFEESSFAYEGVARAVYRRGRGPGVIVMHEIPGITPTVARFATRVADAGFSVFVPHLFGEVVARLRRPTWPEVVAQGACISREFKVLAARESSPITHWLRALARSAHADIGGKGVGAVGMCLTGNFGLALAMDEAVMAPVLSQPSLPFPALPGSKGALHLGDDELARLKERAARGLRVLGMRFTQDPALPRPGRFDHLRRELGAACSRPSRSIRRAETRTACRRGCSFRRDAEDPRRSGRPARRAPRLRPGHHLPSRAARLINPGRGRRRPES